MKVWLWKLCSMILVLVMLFNLIPAQAFALEPDAAEAESIAGETVLEEISTEEFRAESATIVAEIPEKRTAFTKDYKLSNGFYMSVVYPEVVHYEDEGQWKDIDNTLKAVGSGTTGVYTNTAGSWNAVFPQQLTQSSRVSVVKGAYTVSFGMAGELRTGDVSLAADEQPTVSLIDGDPTASVEPTVVPMQASAAQIAEQTGTGALAEMTYPEIVRDKLNARLVYEAVYNNTDIIYDLNGYQLKESVVISSYNPSVQGYRYVLETGTLTPVLNEDGSIDLFAPGSGEIVMEMPAPYMADSAGAVSYDVDISLVPKDGSYLLTYRVPSGWMADAARVWPVVLDPIVTPELNYNNILDQSVMEDAQISYDSGALVCGYSSSYDYGKARTFIQYGELPAFATADVIVKAYLSLMWLGSNSSNAMTIEAHKVCGTWTSQGITWANQPAYNPTIEDYVQVSGSGRYYWDITEVARAWYTGTNTGVMLKATDAVENAGVENYKKFYSVDFTSQTTDCYPCLQIVYRNTKGLESYWDYTATSAGRAGTGYVNNYSGNLTWVHSDIGFGGNRMPVSVSHIYNANDSLMNTFGMGYGWRTNFNQTLEIINDTNSSAAYAWEDSDGTKHYFISEGDAYSDEDGLELTLTADGSGTQKYCITDKQGNKSYFDGSGRLTSIWNNQSTPSNITITYQGTSNLISKITDGVGRSYSFTYTNNLLTRISYVGKGTTELSYVSFGYTGSQLTSITDKDGEAVSYAYGSSNLLTEVLDIDGYKLQYSYCTVTPKRIVGISEFDGTTAGGTLSIAYARNQTTLTDHNGNIQVTQFNDWGNVVCVQDDQGRAQFAQYALNKYDEAQADNPPTANQLTLSSKMQNTVGNRNWNASFEWGTVWTLISDSVTQTITTEEAYIGDKSLKVVTTDTDSPGGVSRTWTTPGKTITVSAYLKTDSNTSAYLTVEDSAQVVTSEILGPGSDWTRVQVSFTQSGSSSHTYTVKLLTTAPGTVYMDCVQFETAETASRYNLIENGDLQNFTSSDLVQPAYWTKSSSCTSTEVGCRGTDAAPSLMSYGFTFTGNPTSQKYLYQTVKVSGTAGDCYVLGGWAKGDSVPLGEFNGVTREFGLKLIFNNTDGTTTEQSVSFNSDLSSDENWQYAATPAVAKKAYSSITVQLVYNYNANTVCFDGIQLFREQFGSSYTYDDDGNVTSVVDLQKQTTAYEYDAKGDLTKVIQNNKAKMTYVYDDNHNVIKATTQTGIVYEFTYDTYGNNTSVSIVNGTAKITSSATYSTDGNRLVSTKDALDKTTTYGYNENTNVLEWVEYPNNDDESLTTYSYDSMYRLASTSVSVQPSGASQSASYTYEDDLLTAIRFGSTTYNFTYGAFDMRTGVSVGSRNLAAYTYTDNQNRYLEKLTYGNGDSVSYTYDAQGRVTCKTYEDGSTVTYTYDNSGALATVTDSETEITTKYYYDLTDRMMKYVETGSGVSHSVGYAYDSLNNLTSLIETVYDVTHSTTYAYDDDNRVTSITNDVYGWYSPQKSEREYTYDAFGRVSQRITKHNDAVLMTETFTYVGNSTQVKSITATSGSYSVTYSYTYDNNGNISTVSDGTNTTRYLYDTSNQLVREDNQAANKTWMRQYSATGNITGYLTYDYTTFYNYLLTPGVGVEPTSVVWNTYGDSEWGDLLTKHGTAVYTYDEIGNLLSDGTRAYTWEHGRQLTSMTDASGDVWTFTYDANGMRLSKRSAADAAYGYVYNGGQLTQMVRGTRTYEFTYDASGTPMTISENGIVYYYVTNLQGDVVALLNSSGEEVVRYTYDAWGKLLTATGSQISGVGTNNPLRYRGYVYDHETGLYYLQSRYYDPELGRWINADSVVAGVGETILGNNLFAYCFNNPVNMSDSTGNWPKLSTIFTVVAVAAVAVAAVAVTVATCGAAAPALAVAGGGIIGGISAGAAATAASVATGAMIVAGVSTAAAVTSAVAEKTVEKIAKRNNSVYVLKDDTGTVQYVGRTNNVDRRRAAHNANPARAGLEMEVIASGLNLPESRALEQAGMAYYHTINTANKMNNQINSVSPKYWGAFKELALGTLNYGWNQMSNEILYWTGN